jgi:hypothetical protein
VNKSLGSVFFNLAVISSNFMFFDLLIIAKGNGFVYLPIKI